MRPRRLFKSPMMEPAKSSGTVISTAMIGSRIVGLACSIAFLNAIRPAIWNDMSFQMAGRIAFRKAMEVAKPTILEPIMAVEITVPDDFAGSIMGDLNSRRGRIQGMDNKGGNTVIKAEVPMSEMLTYGVELTSMTQGRGSFSMEMNHYDVVPGQQQEKIIEKAKAERGEVKEEEE